MSASEELEYAKSQHRETLRSLAYLQTQILEERVHALKERYPALTEVKFYCGLQGNDEGEYHYEISVHAEPEPELRELESWDAYDAYEEICGDETLLNPELVSALRDQRGPRGMTIRAV